MYETHNFSTILKCVHAAIVMASYRYIYLYLYATVFSYMWLVYCTTLITFLQLNNTDY